MSETDPIYNRPGQSALAYRITEQSGSFARMVSRLHSYTLASGPNGGTQPLVQLTTRDPADPSLALLDACAAVFDVLSFYQERLANEAYLRTATEDESVLQLTGMIGYQPAPALAASTYLAFTVDGAPGMPATVSVPAGTQVKSVPAQDELPQTFETSVAITASALYNQLLPQSTRAQTLIASPDPASGDATLTLRLDGLATRLRSGDLLRIAGSTTVRVTQVVPQIKFSYTDVQVAIVDGPPVRLQTPPALPAGNPTALPAELNELTVTQYILGGTWADSDLAAAIRERGWLLTDVASQVAQALQASRVGQVVYSYRQQVACFGARALPYASQPKPSPSAYRGTDPYADPSSSWDDAAGNNSRTVWLDSWGNPYRSGSSGYSIFLERSVAGILPGSSLLLQSPRGSKEYVVGAAGDTTVRGYGTTVRTTGVLVSPLAVATTVADTDFLTRETTVYVQSEPLTLVGLVPLITDPVITTQITLDSLILGLVPGQPILLTGQPADSPGLPQTEVAFLSQATHSGGYTTLYFTAALSRGYIQSTVILSANVAAATHGETIDQEVLGSGDGAQVNQAFALKRAPLTYLPAVAERGSISTLEVRVNGVLWREVATLLSQDARSSSYVILRDQTGQASVQFGDGIHGARLPSGADNVVARYRIGSGPQGEVRRGSLQQQLTRQLGLRSVTNPQAASGGTAAESIAVMRIDAPLSARSLGRAVSLSDYEDLATAYPDIAKAQALAVAVSGVATVHLTVATSDGAPLLTTSTLYQSLRQSLLTLGNPTQAMILDDYVATSFLLTARLRIDPVYLADQVLADVASALRREFAFDRRSFAQPVYSSEVIIVMQQVAGVVGVILDALYLAGDPVTCSATLTAAPAYVDAQGQSHGAELLVLADADLEVLP